MSRAAPRSATRRLAPRAAAVAAATVAAVALCTQAAWRLAWLARAPVLPASRPRGTAPRRPIAARATSGGSALRDLLLGGGVPRAATAPAARSPGGGGLPKVVFLGSPECVCVVLQALVDGAASAPVPFDLCAVVSQPPKRVRKKPATKTPVHELAEALGVEHVWTPGNAKYEPFLEALEDLAPDVCITAAYGQYLPKRFLRTPKLGTLNLHPSLLPRWRGASPVQRSLEAGDEETGITILYTVTKMDAGPLVVQEPMRLVGTETSGELLDTLFARGSELLMQDALPRVLRGEVDIDSAQPQDEGLVTKAPLIQKEEGYLWPHNETAAQMLNKVRAFTGWPGNALPIALSGSKAPLQGMRVLVSDAEVVPSAELPAGPADEERPGNELVWVSARDGREAAIAVRPACDPDHALLVRTLQIPGKKQVPPKDFYKGYMVTQPAHWMAPEEEATLAAATGRRKGYTPPKPKKMRS